MLTKERTAELVAKFGTNEKDTGCTAVQIAILSNRISALTLHLKANHNDNACRRGLLTLVGQRRKLLNYLSKKDRAQYLKVIEELKIRK